MSYQITNKPAPVELKTPADMDHGLTLVHEMGGAPRNWLHEVSFVESNESARQYLQDAGYTLRCGWKRHEDNRQMWTMWKQFPLTVGEW